MITCLRLAYFFKINKPYNIMQFKHLSFFVLTLIVNFNAFCFCADNDALKIFSEGYKKNRESFTDVNCQFLVTQHAQAETIPQALEGKWQMAPKTVVRDGTMLIKEGNIRFELKCRLDVEKIVEAELKKLTITSKTNPSNDPQMSMITVPCLGDLVLSTKDLYRLTYSSIGKIVNIIPKGVGEGGIGIEFSPFDMGVMARNEYSNPHRYLQDCIRGRFSGKYEGTQEINGQQLEIVTYSTKESNNHLRMKFGFDTKKGFLATYITTYDNKTHTPIYEAFITETKRCSGDRYFPMRSVIVFPENGKYRVNSIEVTELNVDVPPNIDLLRLEIPQGYQINVPSFDNQWMKVEEAISVTPQEIEKLHQNCIAYGKAYLERRRAPNLSEPNLTRGRWIKTILIVAGLILIAIGGGGILRHLRKK
jgi:hypothetical protein